MEDAREGAEKEKEDMRGFIASLEKMHLFDVQKLKEEHIAELTKLKLNHANAMTEKEELAKTKYLQLQYEYGELVQEANRRSELESSLRHAIRSASNDRAAIHPSQNCA